MTVVAVEAHATPAEAALAAAGIIAGALALAVASRGRAAFAGSGGTTPGPVYDALAAAELPWRQVSVTLTDERWVEPSSPQSNARLIRERLLVRAAADAVFVPLKGRAGPAGAAAETEPKLAALVPFDVVLLGMGQDGHIASLFPSNPALEAGGLVAWAPAGEPTPDLPRLTLTFEALRTARLTVLLITGTNKRAVLEAGGRLPAHRFLREALGPVRVLWAP